MVNIRKLIVAKISYKFLTFVPINLMTLFTAFCMAALEVHTFHYLKGYFKTMSVPTCPFPTVLGIKI